MLREDEMAKTYIQGWKNMNENFKLRKTFSDKIKCEGRRKNIFVAWRER